MLSCLLLGTALRVSQVMFWFCEMPDYVMHMNWFSQFASAFQLSTHCSLFRRTEESQYPSK